MDPLATLEKKEKKDCQQPIRSNVVRLVPNSITYYIETYTHVYYLIMLRHAIDFSFFSF